MSAHCFDPKVGVTGGSGFLGGALIRALGADNVRCAGRNKPTGVPNTNFIESKMTHRCNYMEFLLGLDVVVHCAALAHIMKAEPLLEYGNANTLLTVKLAQQAAAAGVKRFVFISSVNVCGTERDEVYSIHEAYSRPTNDYAISKLEAEQSLVEVSKNTHMEVVIIRSPMIYGPSSKGNFRKLIQLVQLGIPLPFGLSNNKRSLVAIDNIVDLITVCMSHPRAANRVFFVSDDDDVSTKEFIRRIGGAMSRRVVFYPVPLWLLELAAKIIGKEEAVNRLFGSFRVDISLTKEVLDWVPPVNMHEQLYKTFKAGSGEGV